MDSIKAQSKLVIYASWIITIILVLIPFHAFLTVWLASWLGHYTALRLWKEVLLLILLIKCLYLLAIDKNLRQNFLKSRIIQLIILYCSISFIWGVVAYALDKVTVKALGYGLIVNLRFLAFFLIVWIIATKSPFLGRVWPKLVLIPASLVIVIGLAQRLLLPYDVMKHFGYGSNTIFPYETINHNVLYPRIMSTLRGANPLGAYMVLIITFLAAIFYKAKEKRWLWGTFSLAGLLTLVLSYSRGAWLGLVASLIVLTWILLKHTQAKKLLLSCLVIVAAVGAVLTLAFHNNPTFQNDVLHTEKHSAVKVSSNQGHASAFRSGLHDAVHEPLGEGVGTAGPASVYNNNKAQISENYFIQLSQEVGWLGLIVFLAINFLAAKELWRRRQATLAAALLASLVGLTVVNLVSHGWTDDTIAYLWWGLAGIAIASPLSAKRNT